MPEISYVLGRVRLPFLSSCSLFNNLTSAWDDNWSLYPSIGDSKSMVDDRWFASPQIVCALSNVSHSCAYDSDGHHLDSPPMLLAACIADVDQPSTHGYGRRSMQRRKARLIDWQGIAVRIDTAFFLPYITILLVGIHNFLSIYISTYPSSTVPKGVCCIVGRHATNSRPPNGKDPGPLLPSRSLLSFSPAWQCMLVFSSVLRNLISKYIYKFDNWIKWWRVINYRIDLSNSDSEILKKQNYPCGYRTWPFGKSTPRLAVLNEILTHQ